MSELSDYGKWDMVIVSSIVMLFFTLSLYRPQTRRDWRTFGTFSAFVVALFAEMYGFPLTIYLLSSWLISINPDINWFAHGSGHLLQTLLGWEGSAHMGPLHTISDLFIIGGLAIIAVSWRNLYNAQRANELANKGPYALVRHPQYAAFMVIMLGFLIQWPTLPTLAMFPILIGIYVRLARQEEKEAVAIFGEQYTVYAGRTPRFIPRLRENTLPAEHV